MNCRKLLRTWLLPCAMLITAQDVGAVDMYINWTDAAGDPGPVGDVLTARLAFNSAGDWTATWEASAAHPFTGNARFNLNLYDTAFGNLATAIAPHVSLFALHNFGTTTTKTFRYSGTTPFLANWHVGDQVASGNTVRFLSGVVNMNTPFDRDSMVSVGAIQAAVPEPAAYAALLSGLGLLGLNVLRRKRKVSDPA